MNARLPEILQQVEAAVDGRDFGPAYAVLIRLGAIEKYIGGTNIIRLAGVTGSSTAGTSDLLARSWIGIARRKVAKARGGAP